MYLSVLLSFNFYQNSMTTVTSLQVCNLFIAQENSQVSCILLKLYENGGRDKLPDKK